MSSAPRTFRTSILAIASATLLAACGGGGGSSDDGGPIGGTPPAPAPVPAPPPAPPPNREPELTLPITTQQGLQSRPFDFDVTQGGRTYTDADGDPLTYTLTFDLNQTDGLRIEGTRIVGTPEHASFAFVRVQVSDGAGAIATTDFRIQIDPNNAPTLRTLLDDVIVAAGTPVDVDVTAAGSTFVDADGDSLSYEVDVRGASGLAVDGTRVHGSLANVGAAEVTVKARDGFGGEGVAKFLVAVPAPEPGAPTLPATPYLYEDAQIAMPDVMRLLLGLDPGIFPVVTSNPPTNAGATLGRVLFHDKRLSITNTVACATCHKQDHAFASGNRFDSGVLGIPLKRNSMTITNTRSNGVPWFSDMRAESLHDVAEAALTTADEMGSRLSMVESKLNATAFYEPLFAAAFGSTEITAERALLALEQYLRSVLSYRSRFDRECVPLDMVSPIDCSASFTPQELRGQEIFENHSVVSCTSCHARWSMSNIWHANNGIDDVVTDPGTLIPALQRDGSQGVFRAASLRNIARTAPYMHDGRFATLREVIDHYDHGIKASSNLDFMLQQSGIPRRLDLSEEDKDALEAFLETFTDEDMIADPKFSDPFQ